MANDAVLRADATTPPSVKTIVCPTARPCGVAVDRALETASDAVSWMGATPGVSENVAAGRPLTATALVHGNASDVAYVKRFPFGTEQT